jgi:hypothetical protein
MNKENNRAGLYNRFVKMITIKIPEKQLTAMQRPRRQERRLEQGNQKSIIAQD